MKTTDDVKSTIGMIRAFTQERPHADLSGFLQNIIIRHLQKEKDIARITSFFGKIYDELYYDILFKNIRVEKRVIRLLETLAGPSYSKTESQRRELFEKNSKKRTADISHRA